MWKQIRLQCEGSREKYEGEKMSHIVWRSCIRWEEDQISIWDFLVAIYSSLAFCLLIDGGRVSLKDFVM